MGGTKQELGDGRQATATTKQARVRGVSKRLAQQDKWRLTASSRDRADAIRGRQQYDRFVLIVVILPYVYDLSPSDPSRGISQGARRVCATCRTAGVHYKTGLATLPFLCHYLLRSCRSRTSRPISSPRKKRPRYRNNSKSSARKTHRSPPGTLSGPSPRRRPRRRRRRQKRSSTSPSRTARSRTG